MYACARIASSAATSVTLRGSSEIVVMARASVGIRVAPADRGASRRGWYASRGAASWDGPAAAEVGRAGPPPTPKRLLQVVRLEEGVGDLRRRLLVDVHRRVHCEHRLEAQLRAHRVERRDELGAVLV